MFNTNVQIRRWMAVVSVLGALVVGAMAGSLTVSRGGQRVPILLAASAAPEGNKVSFAVLGSGHRARTALLAPDCGCGTSPLGFGNPPAQTVAVIGV